MDDNERFASNTDELKADIFLLTKPPHSDRVKLCLQLIKRSENAILYLAGDGIYNLLDRTIESLPQDRILVCREDLDARGVQAGDKATVPADFYKRLVDDAMKRNSRIYSF